MRKLKVIIKPEFEGGDTYWEFQNRLVAMIGKILKNGFYSKDGAKAKAIFLKEGDRFIEMSLAHELSHVLIGHKFRMDELGLNEIIPPRLIPKEIAIKILRNEFMAWRLAKSICKIEYWDEDHAIEALKSYNIFPEMPKINWNRIKVISLCDSEARENLKEILSNLQSGE